MYYFDIDELDTVMLQNLRSIFWRRKIAILPRKTREERENERENAAYIGEMRRRLSELDEIKGFFPKMWWNLGLWNVNYLLF